MTLYVYYVPDARLNASYAIQLEPLSPYGVGTVISPHVIGGESEASMQNQGYQSPCLWPSNDLYYLCK